MKTCNGCTWLELKDCDAPRCGATTLAAHQEFNVATGRQMWVGTIRLFLPFAHEMRAPGAACGPERKLYRPNWWFRLWGLNQ